MVAGGDGFGGVVQRLDKMMRSKNSPCMSSCGVAQPRGNFEIPECRRSHFGSFCNAIYVSNLPELCLFADVSEENLKLPIYSMLVNVFQAGRASSVGCTYGLASRRLRVRSSRLVHSFHSLPSADSKRAFVSYWRKNVH